MRYFRTASSRMADTVRSRVFLGGWLASLIYSTGAFALTGEEAITADCALSLANCASTCRHYGFKDTFTSVPDYGNAITKLCHYALATKLVSDLGGQSTATVRILPCPQERRTCEREGWRVTFFGEEPGSSVRIRSPKGAVTTVTKTGTLSENDWAWVAGPLKHALVKSYDGGVLIYLHPPASAAPKP